MTKKILSVLLLPVIGCAFMFSCNKTAKPNVDPTVNYFPLQLGKSVTYAVDSIYFRGDSCVQIETRSQMKYAITDTFTDKLKRTSYIMDVFSRPYDGADWHQISVILMTATPTPVLTTTTPHTTSLLYTQDRTQYVKLIFPIQNGYTWPGNQYAEIQDSSFTYLKNWNYTYQNMHASYYNGVINFENTVTVLEDDESVNYPEVDSQVTALRTYAKEVYAYNVGMVYKEWTHKTHKYSANPGDTCWNGYTVIMRAIDHN